MSQNPTTMTWTLRRIKLTSWLLITTTSSSWMMMMMAGRGVRLKVQHTTRFKSINQAKMAPVIMDAALQIVSRRPYPECPTTLSNQKILNFRERQRWDHTKLLRKRAFRRKHSLENSTKSKLAIMSMFFSRRSLPRVDWTRPSRIQAWKKEVPTRRPLILIDRCRRYRWSIQCSSRKSLS